MIKLRAIQDVGKEILSGNPCNFYVFLGEEYGVKEMYIKELKYRYGGDYVNYNTVSSILSIMRKKNLIPLQPKLYIVRYDDTFLSELSNDIAEYIKSTNILGTIVCIYEDTKSAKKLDKYLPDFCVNISKVSGSIVHKYLRTDFPNVPDNLLDTCVKYTDNYSQAKNMCRMISYDIDSISSLDEREIANMFGSVKLSDEKALKYYVASRNSAGVLGILDTYSDTYDSILYNMLSVMLEMEKLHVNSRASSDFKLHVKKWPLKDIYYFFNAVYSTLERSRGAKYTDEKSSIIYLASLLAFSEIPEGGVL